MAKLLYGESFQPLSRGLIKHMSIMSDSAMKLYIYILMRVKALGKDKGSFEGYPMDCIEDLNWTRIKWYKIIKQLSKYITIEYSKSRHKQFKITVNNYKGIEDFYRMRNGYGKGTVKEQYRNSKGTVKEQYRNSKGTVTTSKKVENKDLRDCNKDNKDNKYNKDNKDNKGERREEHSPKKNLWNFLETSELLLRRIRENKQQKISRDVLETWDHECELMCKQDGRTVEDIQNMINECYDMEPSNTGFTWKNNINSMQALRKQWNKGNIWLGMNKQQKRPKFGRQEVSRKEIEENSKKAMEILRKKREAKNDK